jgi:hypothetical protein
MSPDRRVVLVPTEASALLPYSRVMGVPQLGHMTS